MVCAVAAKKTKGNGRFEQILAKNHFLASLEVIAAAAAMHMLPILLPWMCLVDPYAFEPSGHPLAQLKWTLGVGFPPFSQHSVAKWRITALEGQQNHVIGC